MSLGRPSSPSGISPSTVAMNPAQTYSECPVPEPKFQAPVTLYPPSTVSPSPLGKNWPPAVTRFSCWVKTSLKPSSGR